MNRHPRLESAPVSLLGLPWDGSSSFLPGAAEAPAKIREALRSHAGNLCCETGLDLSTDPRWQDDGDLELGGLDDPRSAITDAVRERLAGGRRVFALGGDHSVTYPALRPYRDYFESLQLVHLDAHPDLYDEFQGDRFSHACPFARILEDGLVDRLVQIGIRAANPHQREQAERFGVITVPAWERDPGRHLLGSAGPWYLSLDLDVLDPAYAPGLSHREPGGLNVRQVLEIIKAIPGPLVGADLVELNPRRDPDGLSATVAAKLAKEILGKMLG